MGESSFQLFEFWNIWIDALSGKNIDPSSNLYTLFFIFIVIPIMLWGTLRHKPNDFLGYCFSFLSWSISVLLILICPLSLLLFLLYRYLYKKIHSLWTSTEDINYQNQYSSHHSNSARLPQNAAHKLCELIWFELDQYVKIVDPALDHQSQLYLWGIYFYVVVKTVKDQQFINEIYSYFEDCAIKRIFDSEHRRHVVHTLRKYYREIRVPLTQSNIDPSTESGIQELWSFTIHYLYVDSEPPQKAKDCFLSGTKLLKQFSIFYHSKSKEVSHFTATRYSISEPSNESELPNE